MSHLRFPDFFKFPKKLPIDQTVQSNSTKKHQNDLKNGNVTVRNENSFLKQKGKFNFQCVQLVQVFKHSFIFYFSLCTYMKTMQESTTSISGLLMLTKLPSRRLVRGYPLTGRTAQQVGGLESKFAVKKYNDFFQQVFQQFLFQQLFLATRNVLFV